MHKFGRYDRVRKFISRRRWHSEGSRQHPQPTNGKDSRRRLRGGGQSGHHLLPLGRRPVPRLGDAGARFSAPSRMPAPPGSWASPKRRERAPSLRERRAGCAGVLARAARRLPARRLWCPARRPAHRHARLRSATAFHTPGDARPWRCGVQGRAQHPQTTRVQMLRLLARQVPLHSKVGRPSERA